MPPRLSLALLTLGILSGFADAQERTPAARPHIVFILADDLGYGDLGSYGCRDIATPVLDQLAEDGLRFTDYYANGPSCSPTRAAFMTARYQQRIGIDDALYYQEMERGLPADGVTIAHALQNAGYATALAGKWHLGYPLDQRPNAQGFNRFFGLLGGNHHYFEHMDRIGVPDLFLDEKAVEMEGYSTDLVTDHAIEFLREFAPEKPVFLFLSHPAPHFPWQGPGDRDKPVEPKKKSWQTGDRETYAAMVEHMDKSIGRVLEEIDRLGIRENTLVVFSSDNGGHTYSSNAPLNGAKATLWEGGVRVPCIARWPGMLPAGGETHQPAITMDWSTTFLALAGVDDYSGGMDGINLLPRLTGRQPALKRTFFWRRVAGPVRKNIEEGRAIRHGRWKLIDQASGERSLFDLREDIGEQNNLAKAKPEVVEKLLRAIANWEKLMEGSASAGPH